MKPKLHLWRLETEDRGVALEAVRTFRERGMQRSFDRHFLRADHFALAKVGNIYRLRWKEPASPRGDQDS